MSLEIFVGILIVCQAIGACFGALTTVWAERAYVKSMKNGRVDHAERAHLLVIGHGLQYGMLLLLLSSLGLVIVSFVQHAALQPALSSSYWILVMLALVIITVSSMLARKRLPFQIASPALFAAWWFLVYLSFGWLSLSFGAAVMSLVVTTAIFYALLYWARFLAIR
jgi:hypothetical protein